MSIQKKMSLFICLISVAFILIGVTRITDNSYQIADNHYKECMQQYEENRGYISEVPIASSVFLDMAYDWKDLAEEVLPELWLYRIEAILCFAAGIAGVVCSIVLYSKNKHID